jgi:hypothetical protein
MLILQALGVVSAIGIVRAGSSCCCAMKAGAACPLRARCTVGHGTCSLGSSASPAVEERTAPAVVEAAFRFEPRPDARGRVDVVSRAAIAHAVPPELPPPRNV